MQINNFDTWGTTQAQLTHPIDVILVAVFDQFNLI